MENIHSILKNHWGYDQFRPLQEDIINSVLEGKDTLALLPTGGGKSICFQVPALAKPGICLVISPLIALMKDQVENLRKRNITAFAIYSGMSRKELSGILSTAAESNCKFLYVSPERLTTNLFLDYINHLDISLLAIDESHCISQWGYDFRPAYLKIADLREHLPDIPVLALTASATPEVQQDIMEKLLFKKKLIFQQSFERPNLSYSVFKAESKINRIVDILKKVPGTGIIYCKSRRRTREISELLNMNGIQSDFYHAGLEQESRAAKQEAWIKNDTRIIVCTNAFGMGIDKPDVRIVIHADVPDCLENYYQEAGRAGRDGKKAYAVLLYDEAALPALRDLPATRFPQLHQLKDIYRNLVNFLQVPIHSGEGEYFAFDLNQFITAFRIDASLAINGLKALEQEEHITLNEQVFIPSSVQFVCNKRVLNEFLALYPKSDPLVKALLRAYEGIFDQPVYIQERFLALQLKVAEEDLITGLQFLQRASIIEYRPRKDKPQVYFLQDRIRPEDLQFRGNRYEERKKRFIARIEKMISYIETGNCRSQLIADYFGDKKTRICKICDNCLNASRKEIRTVEFTSLRSRLIRLLDGRAMNISQINAAMAPVSPAKLAELINFLQQEEQISVNERGEMRFN